MKRLLTLLFLLLLSHGCIGIYPTAPIPGAPGEEAP